MYSLPYFFQEFFRSIAFKTDGSVCTHSCEGRDLGNEPCMTPLIIHDVKRAQDISGDDT